MVLLAWKPEAWFSHLLSLGRVLTMAISPLFSCVSIADEIKDLSVTEVDGEYNLRIDAVLDAPARYVYNIITDYKHSYRINPSITEVEILPTNNEELVRVRNKSEHKVGPFTFEIAWVGDIEESRLGELKVTTIPELSSFEAGSATWMIYPKGERTRVLHVSRLKPKFFIPPVIGDYITKNQMKNDTLDTFDRIECHAKMKYNIDMENDPEVLEIVLAQANPCNTPNTYKSNIVFEDQ